MVDEVSNNGSPGPVNNNSNVSGVPQEIDQQKVGRGVSDDANVQIDQNHEIPSNDQPGQYAGDPDQLPQPGMNPGQAKANGPFQNGQLDLSAMTNEIFSFIWDLIEEISKHDAEAKYIASTAAQKDMDMTLEYDNETAEDQRKLSKTQLASDSCQAVATALGGIAGGFAGFRSPNNQALANTSNTLGGAGGLAAKSIFDSTIGEENAQITVDQSGSKSANHASSVMDSATNDASAEWKKDDDAMNTVANSEAQTIANRTRASKLS